MELDEFSQIDMLTELWRDILFQKLYPDRLGNVRAQVIKASSSTGLVEMQEL